MKKTLRNTVYSAYPSGYAPYTDRCRTLKMKQTITWTFLLTLTLMACSETKSTEKNTDGFTSRLHTTEFETDWYRPLGHTTLEKHLADFKSIDWADEYWKEDSAETFNWPDLEVLDGQNSKYLSVSVCPMTHNSFQFYVGLGVHNENSDNGRVTRTVRLYGTATDKPDRTIALIKLFFDRDFDKLNRHLERLDFFDEIEDMYQNIEKE